MASRHDPREIVEGARLGHATDPEGATGVTAVLFDRATPTVVDHRGGASATYDLASLGLEATFGRRWAIFFAGGSVFGLDAAAGVRDSVLGAGGGHTVFGHPHPIVSVAGAALFDLPSDGSPLPDYRALGREAARRTAPGRVEVGRVGAGRGASVGKYRGREAAMCGGIGWSRRRFGPGSVGVLVAVNAAGAVRDPATGRWVAGARDTTGRIVPPSDDGDDPDRGDHTTLSLVVTDLDVDRPTLQRAVAIAHAGLGGAIVPFHASVDGDVMFGAATGVVAAPPDGRPGGAADGLGRAAAACAVASVLTAVRSANPDPPLSRRGSSATRYPGVRGSGRPS